MVDSDTNDDGKASLPSAEVQIQQFEIQSDSGKTTSCERYGGATGAALVFTHGAGGGIEAPVIVDFAKGFGAVAPIVNFQGNLNLKSRVTAFHSVTDAQKSAVSALGGRSMGARAAVLTALELETEATPLILASWPLTAGKDGSKREPERREQILLDLPETVDVLFIIGTRDAQCPLPMFADLRQKMRARSWLILIDGADHGMEIRPKSATPSMRKQVGKCAADWLLERDHNKRHRLLDYNSEEELIVDSGWTDQPISAEH